MPHNIRVLYRKKCQAVLPGIYVGGGWGSITWKENVTWVLISLQLTQLKLETGCPLLPNRIFFHLQEIKN